MVKGKCTGVGCPSRSICERFTSETMDNDYGFLIPPHDHSGQFPKKCLNFLSNQPHKAVMQPFTIED